jgi:glycopeptide antibiotics resistance protein
VVLAVCNIALVLYGLVLAPSSLGIRLLAAVASEVLAGVILTRSCSRSLYSLAVLSSTLLPLPTGLSPSPPDWPRLLRAVVPLRDLAEILSSPSLEPAILWRNVGGNVLLFVPLGFLLPALRPVNWPRLLLVGLFASVSIEGAQLPLDVLVGANHVVSSDDVLLNVIGASIGCASFLAVRRAVETAF